MSDVKPALKVHTTTALEALETLRGTFGVLDNLLYGARYANVGDENDLPDVDAETPYYAIGHAYDELDALALALRQLLKDVR